MSKFWFSLCITFMINELLKHRFIKEYIWIKDDIAILAFHGGGIEPGTEQICRYIAKKSNSSLYVFSSRKKTGNWDCHISCRKISPCDSANLSEIIDQCKVGIAIHGHAKDNEDIYVSGINKRLLKLISDNLKIRFDRDSIKTNLDLDLPDDVSYEGEKDHILNHFPETGVQIELPRFFRRVLDVDMNGKSKYESEYLLKTPLIISREIIKAIDEYKKKF